MNNVKRIIAAGLVGTAVISTGVVASAEEATQKSPQQELKELMVANGVDATLQEKLIKIADAKAITADQATQATNAINSLLDTYAKYGYSKKQLQADEDAWGTFQLQAQDIPGMLGLKYNSVKGNYNIFDSNNTKLASFTMDEFSSLIAGTTEEKAAKVSNLKTNIAPKLTAYMQMPVADRTKAPTTPVDPGKQEGSTTPGGEEGGNKPSTETKVEEELKELEAIKADDSYTDEQKAAFEKAKAALADFIKLTKFTDEDYLKVKALIDALPDGPAKNALLALLAKDIEGSTNPDGTPYVAPATATPDASNNNTTGTTAKTATNFGNVAVAGLGLMTVAGAVFVISKKKIC